MMNEEELEDDRRRHAIAMSKTHMKPIAMLVWFYQGFTPISVVIALINFALIINLWITAKGFYISAWTIPLIGAAIGGLCVVVGGIQHWLNIQQRLVSYSNQQQNAEITDIQRKVTAIAKTIEERL